MAGEDRQTQDSGAGGQYYRPELDVLRFFAFFSVFCYHALPGVEVGNHSGWERAAAIGLSAFKSAGSFGVCLFFVLSSFLITELLIRERSKTGTVHIKAFYTRRILRIWPLYFFFLFVGFLLGHLVPEWNLETPRLLAFLALLGNWYVAVFGWSANPIAPLWSISIEEQFYLIWPGLAKVGEDLRSCCFRCSCCRCPASQSIYWRVTHRVPARRSGRVHLYSLNFSVSELWLLCC